MEENNLTNAKEIEEAMAAATSAVTTPEQQSSNTTEEPNPSNIEGEQQADEPNAPSGNDPDIGEDDEKSEPREHTRSKMALLFVLGFFSILFLCFAYAIRVKASIAELKDVLVAIIGALSGTLGFIVGFYYKSIKE